MDKRKELAERYTGKKLEQPVRYTDDQKREHKLRPYYPSDRLKESVRLAIMLGRPLLLKGEPGCGKTKLAEAVAYEIYGDQHHNHYFEWHIKSTSKAKDGLYTFDHVKRLRDAQLDAHRLKKSAAEGEKTASDDLKSDQLEEYITYGKLGEAYKASTKESPSILLIDEIDKADIDFPNDLLLEIDQLWFQVSETKEVVEAQAPPILFITSNDEKELPPAFLRRCIFHYIHFPLEDRMHQIIASNFPDLDGGLKKKAIEQFYDLRRKMQDDPNTEKTASTSELIDWVRILNAYDTQEMLAKLNEEELAYSQTLLKSHTDFTLFANHKK
jgi:MoxR-like ATPase